MERSDARSLSDTELLDRRKRAIFLHRKGEKNKEIARLVGVHRNVVAKWITLWKGGGEEALRPKSR